MDQIMILSLLWRGLSWISKNSRRQMSLSIISLRSSISGRDAWNSSMTHRLSQHNRRRCVRTYNRRMQSKWRSSLSSLPKLEHYTQAIRAPLEVCEDIQQKAKHTKMTPFFAVTSISSSAVHSMLLYHNDNFQPGILTQFPWTWTQMFSHSIIINLQTMMLCIWMPLPHFSHTISTLWITVLTPA